MFVFLLQVDVEYFVFLLLIPEIVVIMDHLRFNRSLRVDVLD
jgi:hypothetical protein